MEHQGRGERSASYVTRFDLEARYAKRFDPHSAGGEDLDELWVPAEDPMTSTNHIVGKIPR